VALSTHATKAGLRVLVNASPPFSNVALSLAEDVVAVGGTWLVLPYPVFTGKDHRDVAESGPQRQFVRRSFVTPHRSTAWSSKVSPSRYSR
jgi:hypothetical protein